MQFIKHTSVIEFQTFCFLKSRVICLFIERQFTRGLILIIRYIFYEKTKGQVRDKFNISP